MRTISETVEDIVRRSPFLMEVMEAGVGNNAQIARRIRPDVEKRLLEEVSEASISMALHRMNGRLNRVPYSEKLIKQMNDITVRSNLVELICDNTSALPDILSVLAKSLLKKKDIFLNFSRGLHETLILVSKEFEDEVRSALKGQKLVSRLDNLSAITMRLPESSLSVPGMYYPILKVIAAEGISFVEVMSVRTEFSIIFDDKDVDRAFSAIKRITA
jgi:hypothetical protein